MDRYTRNTLIVFGALVLLGFIGWAVTLDRRAGTLNDLLRQDARVSAYPYLFQVRAVHDGVADMLTPRSASMPAVRFLGLLQPALASLAPDDPQLVAAQRDLAAVQQRARELVEAEPDIDSVRWVPDLAWYERRGVTP